MRECAVEILRIDKLRKNATPGPFAKSAKDVAPKSKLEATAGRAPTISGMEDRTEWRALDAW